MLHTVHAAALVAALSAAACQGAGEAAADPPVPAGDDAEPPAADEPAPGEGAAGDAGPPGRFSVIAVGDVMMGKIARSFIRDNGPDYPFERVRDVLESHDIAFANLEAPITKGETEHMKWKRFHFKVDPGSAEALTRSGIDVVGLANNHMMDFGDDALMDTVAALDGWGIRHAGAGGNLEAARAPVRIEAAGTEVILLAYCGFSPSAMHARDDRPGVAPVDADLIAEDVRAHKTDDNVVLVSMHWGVQHTDRASTGQRRLARQILDAGADAILGHHPHRPQEVEVIEGKVVTYSLGNFLFGYYNPLYRNNIALVLEFEGARLVAARILPVDGKNARIRFRPEFMTGAAGRAVLGHVAGLSSRLGTRMDIVGDEAILDLTASL